MGCYTGNAALCVELRIARPFAVRSHQWGRAGPRDSLAVPNRNMRRTARLERNAESWTHNGRRLPIVWGGLRQISYAGQRAGSPASTSSFVHYQRAASCWDGRFTQPQMSVADDVASATAADDDARDEPAECVGHVREAAGGPHSGPQEMIRCGSGAWACSAIRRRFWLTPRTRDDEGLQRTKPKLAAIKWLNNNMTRA